MFNQSSFNHTPFNLLFTTDVLFSVRMDGEGASVFSPGVTYTASIVMSGDGSMSANTIRDLTMGAVMNADGAMTASAVRDLFIAAMMNGNGSLDAQPKKFHIDSITVNGPFAPGDQIIIDSTKFRVSKNGTIIGYDGDVFDVNPGTNTITYTDNASGRNVLIRVSYRDRYLY